MLSKLIFCKLVVNTVSAARLAAGEIVKDDSDDESESTELVPKEDSESEDEEEKTWKKLQKRSKFCLKLPFYGIRIN